MLSMKKHTMIHQTMIMISSIIIVFILFLPLAWLRRFVRRVISHHTGRVMWLSMHKVNEKLQVNALLHFCTKLKQIWSDVLPVINSLIAHFFEHICKSDNMQPLWINIDELTAVLYYYETVFINSSDIIKI